MTSHDRKFPELSQFIWYLDNLNKDGSLVESVLGCIRNPMASLALNDSSQLIALKSYQTKLCIPTPNHMICKNMCLAAVTSDGPNLDIYLNVDCQKSVVSCQSAPKKPWGYCTYNFSSLNNEYSPTVDCEFAGSWTCRRLETYLIANMVHHLSSLQWKAGATNAIVSRKFAVPDRHNMSACALHQNIFLQRVQVDIISDFLIGWHSNGKDTNCV
uniref:Uncharacterized protein n=1 Tax=Timema cristinae TaxID=61476 RepID=A0A7R9GWS0_TIMCR|nr:unnamed protein product [Timema cristinae]